MHPEFELYFGDTDTQKDAHHTTSVLRPLPQAEIGSCEENDAKDPMKSAEDYSLFMGGAQIQERWTAP